MRKRVPPRLMAASLLISILHLTTRPTLLPASRIHTLFRNSNSPSRVQGTAVPGACQGPYLESISMSPPVTGPECKFTTESEDRQHKCSFHLGPRCASPDERLRTLPGLIPNSMPHGRSGATEGPHGAPDCRTRPKVNETLATDQRWFLSPQASPTRASTHCDRRPRPGLASFPCGANRPSRTGIGRQWGIGQVEERTVRWRHWDRSDRRPKSRLRERTLQHEWVSGVPAT